MNITITIQADNAGDLRNAIAALAGTIAPPVVVGVKTEAMSTPRVEENVPDTSADELAAKKAAQARKKAEKEAAEKVAEERMAAAAEKTLADQEAEAAQDDDGLNPDAPEIPDDVPLRALAAAKAKSAGKQAVKAVLDQFGSPSVTAVPSESRIAFKAALEALA